MDRRTKFILLIVGSLILFGLVIWLIVLPTLAPLFPSTPSAQPSALPSSATPQTGQPNTNQQPGAATPNPTPGIATFEPTSGATADRQTIVELSRRAGVLSERVESGSSSNGFSNLDDAQLDASPSLAATFKAMKADLQKRYPQTGGSYLTVARRLVELPENPDVISGTVFKVSVQMQVQVTDMGVNKTVYLQSEVTFTRSGAEWITSGYTSKPFTP